MITSDDWGSYGREVPKDKHLTGKIFTQRIERNNLTLRTRIKRLARKTICFSRSTKKSSAPSSKTHVLLIGGITPAWSAGPDCAPAGVVYPYGENSVTTDKTQRSTIIEVGCL